MEAALAGLSRATEARKTVSYLTALYIGLILLRSEGAAEVCRTQADGQL
jgi:hypothetical protein